MNIFYFVQQYWITETMLYIVISGSYAQKYKDEFNNILYVFFM